MQVHYYPHPHSCLLCTDSFPLLTYESTIVWNGTWRTILWNWSGLKLISFLPVGSSYIGSLSNWRDLQYVSPSTIESSVKMWKWMMTGASYQTVRDTPKIMPYKGFLFYFWKRCMNLTYVKWEVPVRYSPKKPQIYFICKLISLSVMHCLNDTLSPFRDLIPNPPQP